MRRPDGDADPKDESGDAERGIYEKEQERGEKDVSITDLNFKVFVVHSFKENSDLFGFDEYIRMKISICQSIMTN